MITKKKSSLLKTHKNKVKHNHNNKNHNNKNHNNNNNNNSNSNVSHNSKTIHYKIKKFNDYYNNVDADYNSNYSIMSINSNFTPSKTKKKVKKQKTFLSKVHTLRRMKRIIPLGEDKLSIFLDDYNKQLKSGNSIKIDTIDTINNLFFNHKIDNCICENIYNNKLSKNCKCKNLVRYPSQGSLSSIYSLKCAVNNKHNSLKVMPLNTFYMKMRYETKKYMFVECDVFTHQTLINNYIYKLLPNNCINSIYSGICTKLDYKNNIKESSSSSTSKTAKGINIKGNYHSYNLMPEAELGSGMDFLLKLIEGNYDNDFNITNEEIRYNAVLSFLLQSMLIIAHLQSSLFEFNHGDYKPDNVFIKKCSPKLVKYYKFNAFGNEIKVKNMGFAVLIGDFDKSSITIYSNINSHRPDRSERTERSSIKYRLVPHIMFPLFLSRYVNDIIKEYGDIDPDYVSDDYDIKINKVVISNFIPISNDPTIAILQSAGVKLYRDFDIYTFIITLLNNKTIKKYILLKKLDKTILNFMSIKFKDYIYKILDENKRIHTSDPYISYIIVDTFNKIKEPMYKIFTDDYFNLLKNTNYKLFKT